MASKFRVVLWATVSAIVFVLIATGSVTGAALAAAAFVLLATSFWTGNIAAQHTAELRNNRAEL